MKNKVEHNRKIYNILFFEIRKNSFQRFPIWISRELVKLLNVEIIFLCEENISNTAQDNATSHLNSKIKYITLGFPSVKSYKETLQKINPDLVVVFAHRLPDMTVLHAANKLGMKTIYYQHGIYIPFMKRQPSLFLHNLKKTLRYACHAISLSYSSLKPSIYGFFEFVKIFLFGKKLTNCNVNSFNNLASECLVYGKHWINYHKEEYGYCEKSVSIVGTPDLANINLNKIKFPAQDNKEKLICYVAQTLVEDGRLERDLMQVFLSNLSNAINFLGGQLIIKLHPRSDLTLYDQMQCNFNYSHEFPKANIYIGHYSTILIRGVAYSEKFILIDFPDHIIPDYIEMLATAILNYNEPDKLNETVVRIFKSKKDQDAWNRKINKLKFYFDSNDKDPYIRVAEKLRNILISS